MPDIGEKICPLVGRLATRDGQLALITLINDSGQPLSNRQAAAKAFTHSIGRSGILLTTTEIERQYERYNASENEDAETQKLLNGVLDSIEALTAKQ